MSVLLAFYAIPVVIIYLNVDPLVLVYKQIFEALPVIPVLFYSISARPLLTLVLLVVRYMIITAFVFEYFRIIVLVLIIILLFFGQAHDALDFQKELYNISRGLETQITLKHVLRYREMLIIRESFYPVLSYGFLSVLVVTILFLISENYFIIRMYAHLSAMLLSVVLFCLLVVLFIFKSTLNEGAAMEQVSLEQLRRFRMGTRSIRKRKDIRYVLMAVRSLPAISLYIGLPGFDFLKMCNSTTTAAFMFVVDQTVTVLLTF
jgi:hypothetical protein